MKVRVPKRGAEWAVLGFCAWEAADLWTAWQHSPFDRLGWLAFGIWLAPTLAAASGFCAPGPTTRRSVQLAWLGLVNCLAGIVTDLHVLKHVALALGCAAVTPTFRLESLWLVLSLTWMPALGWLLDGLPAFGVASTRLALAALAALIGLTQMRSNFRKVLE